MRRDEAFFTLYTGLPREGPGDPADVAWAVRTAGLGEGARILDAGSGSGGDIPALLAAVPGSRLTAVDAHEPFVERIRATQDPRRVEARAGDMAQAAGCFDFIWSAGAVYAIGIGTALGAWQAILAPGGRIAFSHPCWFTQRPSGGAVEFWQGYEGVLSEAGIAGEVDRAGCRTLASRRIGDAAWEAYYRPLEARAAALRPGADDILAAVLDEAEAEAQGWRAHRHETGYLLSVVAPV